MTTWIRIFVEIIVGVLASYFAGRTKEKQINAKKSVQLKKRGLKLRLVLLLIGMLCWTGCAPASKCYVPPFPVPDPRVAAIEPEKLPYTWEWVDRLYRLQDQLDAIDEY